MTLIILQLLRRKTTEPKHILLLVLTAFIGDPSDQAFKTTNAVVVLLAFFAANTVVQVITRRAALLGVEVLTGAADIIAVEGAIWAAFVA